MNFKKAFWPQILVMGLLLVPIIAFQNCSPAKPTNETRGATQTTLRGNGEGYSGAVTKYYNYDSSNCDTDQANSIIEVSDVDSGHAYMTRENCREISPKAIAKSSIGLKAHNLNHALYQKRIFEKEGLFGSTQTLCRTEEHDYEEVKAQYEKSKAQAKAKYEAEKAKYEKLKDQAKAQEKKEKERAKKNGVKPKKKKKVHIEKPHMEEVHMEKYHEEADFYLQLEGGQLYASVKVGIYEKDKLKETIEAEHIPVTPKEQTSDEHGPFSVYHAQREGEEIWFKIRIYEKSGVGKLSIYNASGKVTKKMTSDKKPFEIMKKMDCLNSF